MFDSTLVLDNDTGATKNFVLRKYLPDGSERYRNDTTLAEPQLLTVKHQISGKGVNAVDRHLLQWSTSQIGTDGIKRVGVINVTYSVPQQTITAADMIEGTGFILDFLSGGLFDGDGIDLTTNIIALLNGES